jgi:hypothetical protein
MKFQEFHAELMQTSLSQLTREEGDPAYLGQGTGTREL